MISGIQLKIFIRDLEINRAHVSIRYDRRSSYSNALVTVNNADRSAETEINTGDDVSIYYGYRGKKLSEYIGNVLRVYPEKDQVVISIVGQEYPGKRLIKQTWLNETPSAIIQYCLNEIGMKVGRVDEPGCMLDKFVSSNYTVYHIAFLLKDICKRSYGMNMNGWNLFMDSNGAINWGNFVESIDEIPVLETGVEMVVHNPTGSKGYLGNYVEALLIPWFKDSMEFRLIDDSRGIDKVCRAVTVEHEITEKTRTRIGYV